MLALHITNLKDFMNKLLLKDTFDAFLLCEATITTYASFHIDGTMHPDFFDAGEAEQMKAANLHHCSWQQMRPHCFSIIKGKRTPLNFKIILQLNAEETALLVAKSGLSIIPEDVLGLYINCQYDGAKVTLTTGSSLRIFTLDKSLDRAWDEMLQQFLARQDIEFA